VTQTANPQQAHPEFLSRIPREFARSHLILLCRGECDTPVLKITSQSSRAAAHNAILHLGMPMPDIEITPPSDLASAIDDAYEGHAGTLARGADSQQDSHPTPATESLDAILARAEKDLLSTSGKAPVIRLVDAILFKAVQFGASDLHIQPLPDRLVLRHRIDGVLDPGRELPLHLMKPITSRIKVMAGMDVAEHLLPQDGRTSVRIGERACDIRVSTLPTPHGERVVLRLLDTARQLQAFADLGMPAMMSASYLNAARRSSGIILVTGPTGSGKTTTLYATLRELDSRERNIMTIEDPIEYELDSLGLPISQTQVNTKKGVTFANGLRHILRQDPDVILVGEIRDTETARVAIQASLTGHLVFSTLHTNDAPSAVTRLIDLGVEPYLVAASLSVVLAQRLVRVTCPICRGTAHATPGCTFCNATGFKGRRGLFELLPVDDRIRPMISGGASLQELHKAALADGMQSLRMSGDELIRSGISTAEEVERVVHG
jgi:general secretion pathway protein E